MQANTICPCVCQVCSADSRQCHSSVQNRLLGQRRAVSQAGTPGPFPAYAAQAGGRGQLSHPDRFFSLNCTLHESVIASGASSVQILVLTILWLKLKY